MIVMWTFRPDFLLWFALQKPVSTQQVGNACERRLDVFRMGAPETTQNSTCGPIQTQHDFPNLLCEGEMFLRNCQIILSSHIFFVCERDLSFEHARSFWI